VLLRVWVDEWRIGDWGRPIEVGQLQTFLTYDPEVEHIASLSALIGASLAAAVTDEIADMETDLTRWVRGRVMAIDAISVLYSSPQGSSPVDGNGALVSVQRSTLMGGSDRGADPTGRIVESYLINVETG
jgi:hypothetical protein